MTTPHDSYRLASHGLPVTAPHDGSRLASLWDPIADTRLLQIDITWAPMTVPQNYSKLALGSHDVTQRELQSWHHMAPLMAPHKPHPTGSQHAPCQPLETPLPCSVPQCYQDIPVQ